MALSRCAAPARGRAPASRRSRHARGTLAALVVGAALLALPGSALALGLDQKLVAADGTANAQAGRSVAVAGDTAFVGAAGAGGGSGAVYVFTRSGDTWSQVAKLTPADPASVAAFGWSVAADGGTLVVGAPAGQGAAYVFTGAGSSWTQDAKLIASDGAPSDALGRSVAIDGDTIVAGAPSEGESGAALRGAAYTFARSAPGALRTDTAKLIADDAAAGDRFGGSVGVDTGTIVVGAEQDNVGTAVDQGSAYVFTGVGSSWTQSTKLTAADGSASDLFGTAVAIDGDTIAAGSITETVTAPGQGAVYVFTGAGASWPQTGKLLASDATTSSELGYSVAIDGDTIAAGAYVATVGSNSAQGAVYTFARSGAPMRSQVAKLVDSDGAPQDLFGSSVAIDGSTVIAGAPSDDVGANPNQGSAVVFFDENENEAPVAMDDGPYTVVGGGVLMAAAPGVLANDSDADADALTAQLVSGPASGTLDLAPDGSFTYTAGEDAVGAVTFTYQTSDGSATSNVATVTIMVAAGCDGVPATIVGTSGSETLNGTGANDVIVGRGGNDRIEAGGGLDRICGGSGNDTIGVGAGNDRVFAGSGHDSVAGGSGDDVAYGGDGDDRLEGGGDRDRLFGEAGIDRLFGGGHADHLDGGTGTPDRCDGEGGADTATACEQMINVP